MLYLNETVNKKYLYLNSGDVITNHPIIFSRFFIKTLRKCGLNINKDRAKEIQKSMYDSKDNNIINNSWGVEFKVNNIDFKIKLSGSNFFIDIYYKHFKFNTNNLTLKDLLNKIQDKILLILKNEINNNDPDIIKSNFNINLLNKYCNRLEDKFMFYKIHNEYTSKLIKKEIRINISFSLQEFFNEIENGFGRKFSSYNDGKFNYLFQKNDLKKITTLLINNIQNLYNINLNFIKFEDNNILIVFTNDNFKLNIDIQESLEQHVGNLSIDLFKIYLFNKIFEN